MNLSRRQYRRLMALLKPPAVSLDELIAKWEVSLAAFEEQMKRNSRVARTALFSGDRGDGPVTPGKAYHVAPRPGV